MKGTVLLKGLFFIVLLAVFIFLQLFWDIAAYVDPEKIQHLLADAGILAPVVYIVIMSLAVVVSPIPSIPLDIAAGIFFGPYLGTLYSVIGAVSGSVMSFMIARLLGRQLIERFLGGHIIFCGTCSDKLLTKVVFISRLLPFVSFDIISYGAGLTKMTLYKFCLATFLGMIPLTFIYNYFGSVIVAEKSIALVLGIILTVLFFLLPYWIERYNLLSLQKYFRHQNTE